MVIIPLNENGLPVKQPDDGTLFRICRCGATAPTPGATFPMWLVACHVALVTASVAMMVLS